MRINWKLALPCIAIGYFHCIGLAKAQPFTFADTHPVNNPDSLEQWLTANPKAPVLVRIKNLITLERTRYWLGANKIGHYIPAIHALAVQTRNPTALAAYEFVSAKKASLHDDFYSATLHGSRALNLFEKLNDASGQINTHGLLFSIIYDQFGHPTAADSSLTEAHWKQCQTILTAYPNPHDQLYIDKVNVRRTRNQADIYHMEQLVLGTLQYIKSHPECSYARGTFEHTLSGLYFEKGNFWAAYRQVKKVLTIYPTTDPHELASLYYNLGNICLKLNRLNEGFGCYENAIKFSLAATPVRYTILIGANNNASALADKNGLFKKAFSYMAQARAYEMKANSQENNRRMQDLQARYESSRRQRQIDLLRV